MENTGCNVNQRGVIHDHGSAIFLAGSLIRSALPRQVSRHVLPAGCKTKKKAPSKAPFCIFRISKGRSLKNKVSVHNRASISVHLRISSSAFFSSITSRTVFLQLLTVSKRPSFDSWASLSLLTIFSAAGPRTC
jgi:hypothetical protein